jgi:hypothetical protein
METIQVRTEIPVNPCQSLVSLAQQQLNESCIG